MADLTASILTLMSAAGALGELINSLRNAPDELLALSNEVADLQIVLSEVHQYRSEILSDSPDAPIDTSLDQLLNRSKNRIYRLNQFIKDSGQASASAMRRIKWVTKKPTMKSLVKELQEVRHGLCAVLSARNALGVRRIDMAVTSLVLKHTSAAAQEDEAHSIYFDAVDNLDALEASMPAAAIANPRTATTVVQGRTILSVVTRTCSNWCSCSCHTRHRLKTPSILHNVFGSLFVGYTGFPNQGRRCTETTCAAYDGGAPFRAEVKYFFPSWLLNKALIASFSTMYLGPTLSLSVRNVIPLNSPLFIATQRNWVANIRYLFSHELARPNDIGGLYGDTALHDSIYYKSPRACRALLDAGADPFIENDNHISAVDSAWTRILAKDGSPAEIRELELMFPMREHLEYRGFSPIHKIV